MSTRIFAIIATALAGTAGPAAAVPFAFSISSLENAMYVSSSTSGYDAWAATCDNVKNGSGCEYTDAGFPNSNNDETLFFWGELNANTNSQIDVTWSGATDSDDIDSVRITTLRDDDGSMPALGPADGPKDLFGGVPSICRPYPGRGAILNLRPCWDVRRKRSRLFQRNSPRQRIALPHQPPRCQRGRFDVLGNPDSLFEYNPTLPVAWMPRQCRIRLSETMISQLAPRRR